MKALLAMLPLHLEATICLYIAIGTAMIIFTQLITLNWEQEKEDTDMKKSIFTALKNNLSTFSSVFQQENTEHDNIKLFVSHHKPFHQIDLPGYTPIQVGKEKATHQLNMIGDNTGDHISSLNPYFCELTAQYWVWKNVRADHVGFCHYRRFFNIGSRITPSQISLSTFQKKTIYPSQYSTDFRANQAL